MTLDMLHAERRHRRRPRSASSPVGGTGSILHAVLAYRERARNERGIATPNVVKPETAHPAFDKACHLLGIELRRAPVDPDTTLVDVDAVADAIDDNTVAIIGSALQLRLRHDRPDRRALGTRARARRRPARRRLPRRLHPAVGRGARLRHPGLRLPPAGRHHDLGRHPQVRLRLQGHVGARVPRQGRCRNGQYFFLTDWTGGKYCSPGIEGSRSGGLLAATWAAMVAIGRDGYLGYARADLRDRVRDAGRGARAPRAADHRHADVLLQLHVRRVRHLPRERLHADEGLALQRPAVPERDPHGGDAPADPAGRGRRSSPPISTRRSRTRTSTRTRHPRAARSTAASPAA